MITPPPAPSPKTHLEIREESRDNQNNEKVTWQQNATVTSNIHPAIKPKAEKLKPEQETSKQLKVKVIPLAGWAT